MHAHCARAPCRFCMRITDTTKIEDKGCSYCKKHVQLDLPAVVACFAAPLWTLELRNKLEWPKNTDMWLHGRETSDHQMQCSWCSKSMAAVHSQTVGISRWSTSASGACSGEIPVKILTAILPVHAPTAEAEHSMTKKDHAFWDSSTTFVTIVADAVIGRWLAYWWWEYGCEGLRQTIYFLSNNSCKVVLDDYVHGILGQPNYGATDPGCGNKCQPQPKSTNQESACPGTLCVSTSIKDYLKAATT